MCNVANLFVNHMAIEYIKNRKQTCKNENKK